jgi:glutamate--cysteine ligase
VPAAVTSALFEDPRAADAAMAATEPIWHGQAHSRSTGPVGGKAGAGKATSWGNGGRAADAARSGSPWLRAARCGPADPVLARASQQCFEAADAALARANAPADIRRSVATFAERYVLRRRCPADDQLEGIH